MKKTDFYCIAGFVFALGCASWSSYAQPVPATDAVKNSGKFTIGNSLAYAPFEMVNSEGKTEGLDIELAEAVADTIGAKLDIITIPFASQIPSLASGRIKVAWAPFSVLKDRLRQVDFVVYMQAPTVASVLPNNRGKFSSKNDLCGKTIAVQTGSSADFAADRLIADCKNAGQAAIRKDIYPAQQDTIQAVLTGRASAMLDDSTTSAYYETTSNKKLVVVPGEYSPTPLGVAVQKGDRATAAMMVAAFNTLLQNGTYTRVLKKYNLANSAVQKIEVFTDPSQLVE